MGEIGIKQTKSTCDNEKYIPTTKYVTITPKIFLSPYFLIGDLRPK